MANETFKLSSVSFKYDKTLILDDVSLSIEKGKFTSICGRNGSGKSTLLKLISGILKNQKGDILLYNKKLNTYKKESLYKTISYVPQVHNIEIPLTVSEIILTGRYPHQSFIDQNSHSDLLLLEETIKKTSLIKYKDTLFNNLSGGEKQKVLIARALCQTEDIILLDEPTSSLDIGNKIEIMEILTKLVKTGTTVIAVSHDINEVNKYSDNIIFIKDKTALSGNKETLLCEENLLDVYNADIKFVMENGNKIFYY